MYYYAIPSAGKLYNRRYLRFTGRNPGSRRMDYFIKLFKYRTAGVHEYWIVDPAKNFVIVYNFDTSDSGQYTFADTIKAGIYEELYIDFSKINL